MPKMTANQVADMIDSDSDPAAIGGGPMKFSEWFQQNQFDECADMIDGGMDTITFLYVDYVNEFRTNEG